MPELVPKLAVVEMPKGADFGSEDLASAFVHPNLVVIGRFPVLWSSFATKS